MYEEKLDRLIAEAEADLKARFEEIEINEEKRTRQILDAFR